MAILSLHNRRFPDSEFLLLAGLSLFVISLSALPLGRLLLEGIAPGGTTNLDIARDVLGAKSTWIATQRTLVTGIGGAVVSVVVGAIFALLVALTDIRAKGPLVFCFMIPMMIPPQITALAWIQLFGPSSALLNALGIAPPLGSPHPMYSPEGLILLLGVQHAPLVFLALRAGLRNLPRETVEAARISGAGRIRVMWDVVIPLMAPPLIAGGALAFVSAVGNFGIPAMLGVPISYSTLPVLIYQRLSGFGPSIISEVAVLSIVVGLLALAGLLVQGWMLSRRDYRTIGAPSRTLDLQLGRWRPAAETACWLVIAMILIAPLLALAATSLVPAYGVRLSPETASLEAYREVIFRQAVTARAFGNSFLLAGGAALVLMMVAIPLGYFLAWRRSPLTRFLDIAAETPYALPGVVLAIACILIFLKPIPIIDISIYGTLWIIFAAYLGRFLTLGLRPVVSAFVQTDRALEEAAQSCGAGFLLRLRTAIAPAIAPSAAAGAILVFMTAFNELTVSALLWSSGTETLGVVVFSLDDGGYAVLAAAVAMLAVGAILLLMIAAHGLSNRLPRGVLPWRS